MNALTPISAPMAYGDMERLAASIAKSGLFGMKTADQALVLMMIAHSEGRHPVLAARDYDIIQGKPAKKAEAMARDFLSAGGKIEWHALSDTIADATFSHPAGGTARIVWDLPRAKQAGLAGKDLWAKYPRQMLRSRTVSEGVRTVWPMATSGMYEPGEARDIPAEPFAGTTIDAAPEPAGEAPDAPTAEAKPRRTINDWLAAFALAARDVQSAEAANALICGEESLQMKEHLTAKNDPRLERYTAIVSGVLQTWFAEPPADDDAVPEMAGSA